LFAVEKKRQNALAFLWGLAEATFFFIVPDVFLTALALRNLRGALVACFSTLLGALLGGTLMYIWGVFDLSTALRVLDAIPAISQGMLNHVRNDLHDMGLVAILRGPLWGTPYKIFAVQAHPAGISLLPFLLVSIPARLARFVLVTLLAWFLSFHVFSSWSLPTRDLLLVICWIAFYAFYFSTMPG